MYKIIPNRKIWLTFSGVLVAISLFSLLIWGLNLGIDFTGGSLLEVQFTENRPANNEVEVVLEDLDLGSLYVQPVDETNMLLRFQDISEDKHQEVLKRLRTNFGEDTSNGVELELETASSSDATNTPEISVGYVGDNGVIEQRYDSVGPTIGKELKEKSVSAMMMVLIFIVLYIAIAFRRVSKPVASWKYGLSAIIALFHDVIITMGVFAILGEFYDIEVNTPFVAAMLTVLGYSVNDTIVVFDRVRENLPKSHEDFEGTVNTSVNQTIRRSINTSVTTLIVLLAVLFFGGETIRSFVLALSIGVFVGTYSSIFLASPILVLWEKYRK